jgi:hypothetical protein
MIQSPDGELSIGARDAARVFSMRSAYRSIVEMTSMIDRVARDGDD